MSPMAQIAGSEVRAASSTTTPFSQANPAVRASPSQASAPTPTRTASASISRPSPSRTPASSNPVTSAEVRISTPWLR